ncbi:hypothetical protein [Caulobacter sp.]|uniref:hypothetical protein n=1 Tax=Caulobacter sp. TaxID=78 RepID=UPI003BAF9FBB
MSFPDTASPARDTRVLDWEDQGDHDWIATAPGGWELSYAGARMNLWKGNWYTRGGHVVTLTRRGKTPACLLREGGFDQFAKRIGYAVEPQTGDVAFDRRIYLATDHAGLGRALGDRPELRRVVLALFDLKVLRIDVTVDGFKIYLDKPPSPNDDGGAALSDVALRLEGLSDLWPAAPSDFKAVGGWLNRRGLSLAWFFAVAALVFVTWHFSSDRAWHRQLETFAEIDWPGMGLLVAVAVGPYAVFGGRRATSHKTLALLVVGILILLPLSQTLLVININRLHVRSETLVPAVPTGLWPDPDRQYSKGYLLDATVEGVPLGLSLSPAEGKLAVEGRLCMTGVVHEGLRGLRYVWGVRTWTCGSGEVSHVPPPSPMPAS